MSSIGPTVTPAILPAPKLVPQSFSDDGASNLGADQQAATVAHTALTKAAAQFQADTKAKAGPGTLKGDQQLIAARQAEAIRADAKVQQDGKASPLVNVTA